MFEPVTEFPQIAILIVLLAVALVNDILFRRIPNIVIILGLVFGIVSQVMTSGPTGLLIAAGGAVVGLASLLPFYVSGALGAGDVKLMAMCGAFIGPVNAVIAAAASLFAGGVIGVLWYFWHYFSEDETSVQADASSALAEILPEARKRRAAIPYALAIFAGVSAAIAVSAIR